MLSKALQGVVVDADYCEQEGYPAAICVTMMLEKPLAEDTVVVQKTDKVNPQG